MTTKSDQLFNEIFNLPETPPATSVTVREEEPADITSDEQLEVDFKKTRENLQDIIAKGMEALTTSLEIAKNSEHPRAFEVSAGIMKTVNDISKDLITLHKTRKEIKYGKAPTPGEVPQIQNQQNNYISTTSEVLKQIRMQEDKEFIDVTPNKE